MRGDTDVTPLHSVTLVSPHLSVALGSRPFGPDPYPHPALGGRKRQQIFILFVYAATHAAKFDRCLTIPHCRSRRGAPLDPSHSAPAGWLHSATGSRTPAPHQGSRSRSGRCLGAGAAALWLHVKAAAFDAFARS